MTYQITRRLEFDAAHRVPLHESKCRALHGHRYRVEVTCASADLDDAGFVVDFGVVKAKFGAWLDKNLDHTTILSASDHPTLGKVQEAHEEIGCKPPYVLDAPPTAEVLAEHLFGIAQLMLADHRIRVVRLRLYETPNCWADWPCTA